MNKQYLNFRNGTDLKVKLIDVDQKTQAELSEMLPNKL